MIEQGTRFGKFEIIQRIGRGGMADVYEAKDTELYRNVALKILPPELARDENWIARFMKEIRSSAAIAHPNVVPVYDMGEENGLYFYAMQYLGGGHLKAKIRQGEIRPNNVLSLLKQIAGALGAAHEQGIVHRDVKPENILFDGRGRPILTDLGIARAISGTRITKTGMSIGTPNYMSPEQARGRELDGRSDIYSLGIVFFEMLTGTVPYKAEENFAVALKHINAPVPILPSNFAEFQPLIDSMLAKNSQHRHKNCATLIADIERLEKNIKPGDLDLPPVPDDTAETQLLYRKPSPLKTALIGVLLALAAGGIYGYKTLNKFNSGQKIDDGVLVEKKLDNHAIKSNPKKTINDQRIAELFQKAKACLNEKPPALITHNERNALKCYQEIMKYPLDKATRKKAMEGFNAIIEAYCSLYENAKKNKKFYEMVDHAGKIRRAFLARLFHYQDDVIDYLDGPKSNDILNKNLFTNDVHKLYELLINQRQYGLARKEIPAAKAFSLNILDNNKAGVLLEKRFDRSINTLKKKVQKKANTTTKQLSSIIINAL